MGYRSEVMVAITVENEDNFKKYLEELKDNRFFHLIDGDTISTNGKDGIKLHWPSIKWYNTFGSYPEINEFESWLDEIVEDEGTSYHFIRVGEELEDVEERIEGDPNYWVYIDRSLSADF